MKNLLFVLTCLFLFSSCEDKAILKINQESTEQNQENAEESAEQFDEEKVYVRVVNKLEVTMENVRVNDLEFGDLAPGQTSRYLSEEDITNYHFAQLGIETSINDEKRYSNCMWVCGTPPIPTYVYESGVLTLKVKSENAEDGWGCLEVKQIEDETVVAAWQ